MFKHVKFAGLPVDDQDRAVAFYTEKVGLEVATDAPPAGKARRRETRMRRSSC